MKHSINMRITSITYYLLLYAFWACLECVIVPKLETQTLPVSVELIKEIRCKILLWVLPSVFLILRNSNSMFLPIHFPIRLRDGVYDQSGIYPADRAEPDFHPDICKEPEYPCTGHSARMLGFIMLCNRMSRADEQP